MQPEQEKNTNSRSKAMSLGNLLVISQRPLRGAGGNEASSNEPYRRPNLTFTRPSLVLSFLSICLSVSLFGQSQGIISPIIISREMMTD